MSFKVIDLGTKTGGALREFLKEGALYFGDVVKTLAPRECLGVDRNAKYQRQVEGQGYRYRALDLCDGGDRETLPEADYYLAWDFLEHLPSKEAADTVLQFMLDRARIGVWLRMPSFETDETTGEGALRLLGLRFAWTHWKGHPNPYQIRDVRRVLTTRWGERVKIKEGRPVMSTDDPCVVPIAAPLDTVKYSPTLGAKVKKTFYPPLVGQWEVIIYKNR